MNQNLKKYLFTFFFLFNFTLIFCQGNSFLNENQVILNNDQSFFPSSSNIRFSISQKEILPIPNLLSNFLKTNLTEKDNIRLSKKEQEFILSHLNKYRIQYIGFIQDGKKYIYCNIFLGFDDKDTSWKKEFILIMDGGPSVWAVKYDIDTKTFFDFRINGYA